VNSSRAPEQVSAFSMPRFTCGQRLCEKGVAEMHILHVLEELKPSGAEVMLQSAARHWRDCGLQSEILSLGANLGIYASVLSRAGYNIHYMGPPRTFQDLWNLRDFLKAHHYDAVHIHLERASFWIALMAYNARVRKIAYTSHGMFRFEGSLRLERCLQRWIMRQLMKVRMVSISPSSERNEREQFGNGTVMIPNWFDDSRYTPPSMEDRDIARKQLGISEGVTVFTSVGGCWPYKNHGAILKAIANISGSDRPLLYVHIGQEKEGCPERKMTEAMGISDRVRFLGIVSDVVPILHASDVYIMPSLAEGFGIAAVEAMGTGLPAILSDVPGLTDFREAGEGIRWVQPTPESIREGILHFLETPASIRREMGSLLSRYAHEYFSAETGALSYSRLYR
jgi:glycosyltransferase involved in cell wall biosynthesis